MGVTVGIGVLVGIKVAVGKTEGVNWVEAVIATADSWLTSGVLFGVCPIAFPTVGPHADKINNPTKTDTNMENGFTDIPPKILLIMSFYPIISNYYVQPRVFPLSIEKFGRHD